MLLIVGIALAAPIIDRPTAQSSGDKIVIKWKSGSEANLNRFEILRKSASSTDFTVIGRIGDLKGSNSSYEFTDQSAFKANGGVFVYVIQAVYIDGSVYQSEPVTVSHLSSTYRRTWGSIKAMFR